MARYRLMSVKFSRREHKKDAQGNLMYRDEERKVPIYELKQYGIGDDVELTPAEAKRLKKDIQPLGGTVDQPTPLQFVPDDEKTVDDDMIDSTGKIEGVLSGTVDQILGYVNDHEDDPETLEQLRNAEAKGKKRKGVLDAIDNLLNE